MKRILHELTFIAGIIFILMLVTAQHQWNNDITRIHWVLLATSALLMIDRYRAVLLLLITTTILELYASTPFGIMLLSATIALSLALLSVQRLFKRFSLHGIILNGLILLVSYHLIFFIFVWVGNYFELFFMNDFSASNIFSSIGWQIITHTLALILFYYGVSFMRKFFIQTNTYA